MSQSFRTPAPARVESVGVAVSPRPVYRLSIVPGGAYSQKEVVAAVRRDAVVAAHYKSIDVERVRPVTVPAARAVYVSYRRGSEVFWTKRPVQLTPGETLLSDGTSEIRARCGNRVSDHPQQPVAPGEPAIVVLDEIETDGGSSSMAAARTDSGGLTHLPFMPAWGGSAAGGHAPDGTASGGGLPASGPLWGGAGGPFRSHGDLLQGLGGGSHVVPLGSGEGGGSGGPGGSVPFPPPGSRPGGSGTTGTTKGETNGGTGGPTTTGAITRGITLDETTDGGLGEDDSEVPSLPEPASLTLLGLAACGVVMRAWRARR